YADATVAEVAQALGEIARMGGEAKAEEERVPPGVDSWVRTFTVELVERALPRRRALEGASDWRILAPTGDILGDRLREAFAGCAGSGTVVCLPSKPDEQHLSLVLEGAHAALANREHARFVLVQHGGGAA